MVHLLVRRHTCAPSRRTGHLTLGLVPPRQPHGDRRAPRRAPHRSSYRSMGARSRPSRRRDRHCNRHPHIHDARRPPRHPLRHLLRWLRRRLPPHIHQRIPPRPPGSRRALVTHRIERALLLRRARRSARRGGWSRDLLRLARRNVGGRRRTPRCRNHPRTKYGRVRGRRRGRAASRRPSPPASRLLDARRAHVLPCDRVLTHLLGR